MPVSRQTASAAVACALLLALATSAAAATLFDPRLTFRTVRTEHFVIHFHQGEEAMAQRLTVIAEDAWLALQRSFGRH